jgi:hypothetical protein
MAVTLSEGRYKVRLAGHELTETQKGTPDLCITFDVLGYYDASGNLVEDGEDVGRRNWHIYLTPGTLGTAEQPGMATRTLRDLGYDKTSLAHLDPDHQDPWSFADIVCDLRLKKEEYNGRIMDRWDFSKPKKKATGLNKLDGSFTAATTARSEPVTPANRQPAAEAPTGEAVPF